MAEEKFKTPLRVIAKRKAWAAGDAKRDKGLTEPETLEKFKDITYGPHGEWNLLDLYKPANADNAEGKRLPVIMSIHGGGFFYGDKELYRFYCMHLAEFGFAVVNINYRLAPQFKFPSPVEDSITALGWIAENADRYGLDIENVFLVGDSAGAQLVSQVAAIASDPEYAKLFEAKIPENLRIGAVSLACGLYSLKRVDDKGTLSEEMIDYLGDKSVLEDPRVDVLSHVTGAYPPAYVFSSECDFLRDACKPMADLINSRGGTAQWKIYGSKDRPDISHVFHVNMRLEEGEKANRDQTDFFKKHIKGTGK